MNTFQSETLNEFLLSYIQQNDMSFVVEHFLELREEYYACKETNAS